jgi:hypothetical protein
MTELICPPNPKAGGRSVSISEERQFGVSAIYRYMYTTQYTCTLQNNIQVHYTIYRYSTQYTGTLYNITIHFTIYRYTIQYTNTLHNIYNIWITLHNVDARGPADIQEHYTIYKYFTQHKVLHPIYRYTTQYTGCLHNR